MNFIIERVRARAQSWKNKLLSPAGKEVMIKAVLQALPAYTMSVFKLQKETINEIKRVIKKCWWGSTENERRINWMGWDKITRSKQLEGLGIRDLEIFNIAMLAKLAWRFIHKPEKLWVKVLMALYCPSNNPLSRINSTGGSWVWQSLQLGLKGLKFGLRWCIGNGVGVHIWDDPWIPSLPNFKPVTAPNPINNFYYVKDLLNEEGTNWDEDKLQRVFSEIERKEIHKLGVGREAEDRLIWHFYPRGRFTIRSCYHVLKMKKDGDGDRASSSTRVGQGIRHW